MPTAGVTHHLVLNGVGYMLRQTPDPPSGSGQAHLAYRRGEEPYLVPRRADAVGRAALTRPGLDNGGFAAGPRLAFGHGGYARSEGVDARAGDGLRLATKAVSVTGLGVRLLAWADFNGTVYAGAASGAASRIYRYTVASNTFAELGGSAVDVARLVPTAGYLWAVPSGGGPLVVNTANSVAAASGANANTLVDLTRSGARLVGVTAAGSGRSVTWCGLGGETLPSIPFTSAAEDGDPREPSAGLAALGEAVYLAKRDGLYHVTWSGDTVSLARVVDHTARRDPDNFKALAVFRDALYYTVRDRLYRFDGHTEADVSPPATVAGPLGDATTRYVVKALSSGSGWLWALTESDESPPSVHLWAMALSGSPASGAVRWEQVATLAQAANAQAGSLHASAATNALFVNYYNGAGWLTQRLDLRATSDLPAPNFPTSGSYVYLAPLDGGLPDVPKRFHSVALRGSGLSASTAVAIAYWSGSSWISLGSLTTVSGGEILFPTVDTGRSLLLRLELRSDGTHTPVVSEVGVSYDILPGPARTVTFEALLAPHLRLLDGTAETVSPATLLANLDACRAAGAVVSLVDPVQSAGGGNALNVRVAEVTLTALVPTPTPGGYGWLAAVRCEVVGET